MSVLIEILFCGVGALAITALLESWRQFVPRVAALRYALRRSATAEEIRITLHEHEHVLAPARRTGSALRHMRRPKPIRHRLAGRTPRRAIA
jgi:hypothetical protein